MVALLNRSKHDWVIYTSHYEPENTFDDFKNYDIRIVGNVTVDRDMGSVLKSALNISKIKFPLNEYDAFAVWCDGIGTLTTFRNSSIPCINICSTPLRAVYDPVYVTQALLSRKPAAKLAYHLLKNCYRFVDRMAWSRFDGVVATSIEVQSRIVRNKLYREGERMILRHPGVDVSDAPDASQIDYEPFFLVPGRISWTKNVQLAIEAFLKADLPRNWKLKLAGFVDRKSQGYIKELRDLAKDDDRIVFIENPNDEVLSSLYCSAYSVLFTPLNEDWGMTPLEAMLRSKLVIANRSGGPMESVLDGVTGFLLDPDADVWAAKLRALAEEPKRAREMGANARRSVERYDWSQFVDGIDEQLSSLLFEGPAPVSNLPFNPNTLSVEVKAK